MDKGTKGYVLLGIIDGFAGAEQDIEAVPPPGRYD
jgi:hypothetical protein